MTLENIDQALNNMANDAGTKEDSQLMNINENRSAINGGYLQKNHESEQNISSSFYNTAGNIGASL